jgi:hypothetical protein
VPPETIEQQGRWSDAAVAGTLLADAVTVAARGDIHLVAPPVPLGPLDLWLVPTGPARFLGADVEVVAALVERWIAGVHALVRASDHAGVDPRVAPFDAKVVVHPELPDGTGRWWAELTVTDRHAPGVAAVPLVDLRSTPPEQARRFRPA